MPGGSASRRGAWRASTAVLGHPLAPTEAGHRAVREGSRKPRANSISAAHRYETDTATWAVHGAPASICSNSLK
jgi:hypothetical protein